MNRLLISILALFLAVPAQAQVTSLVSPTVAADLGDYTVATLPTCNAAIARRTAWVTDLMGLPNGDRAICDGSDWKPIRPLAVQIMTVTGTGMTVGAMTNAPTVVIDGTIGTGVTFNVTLSALRAYRGARQCIIRKATGLGGMLLVGLSATLPLNGWVCYEYGAAGWVQTQSGGLL